MSPRRATSAALVAALVAGAQLVWVATCSAGADAEATTAAASPRVPAAAGRSGRGPARPARVPPGVLARAVSRLAREREAAEPADPRAGRPEGDVLSVEIRWYAGDETP